MSSTHALHVGGSSQFSAWRQTALTQVFHGFPPSFSNISNSLITTQPELLKALNEFNEYKQTDIRAYFHTMLQDYYDDIKRKLNKKKSHLA